MTSLFTRINSLVRKKGWVVLLLCVVILSLLREPLYFVYPRIWAEEGTVHLRSALDHGLVLSLFVPHLGYFSFFNNYVTSIGLFFTGLGGIAYVTTFFSYLVILLTIFAPFVIPSNQWVNERKRALIVLFGLFIGTAEIWVNTVNAQFYLGLFAAFVVLGDISNLRGWKKWYVYLLLWNGALTGVTTVVLTPLLIYRFLRENIISPVNKKVIIIFCIGLSVQLCSLFYLSSRGDITRFSLGNLPNLPYGFFRNITSFVPASDNAIRVLFFSLLIYFTTKLRPTMEQMFPLIIALYVSFVFAFLALGMVGGARYGYIPSVLLFIYLLNIIDASSKKFEKYRKSILLLSFLIFLISFIKFFRTYDFYDPNWTRWSLEHSFRTSSGTCEIKLFPQWRGTDWRLELPSDYCKEA